MILGEFSWVNLKKNDVGNLQSQFVPRRYPNSFSGGLSICFGEILNQSISAGELRNCARKMSPGFFLQVTPWQSNMVTEHDPFGSRIHPKKSW